jgi:hypothetical protein
MFAMDFLLIELLITGSRHCRDRKVVGLVGFTTTYGIRAYNN